MPKVTHVVIDNIVYYVNELTLDTLGEFVEHDVPKVEKVEEVLRNEKYKTIKVVGNMPKM